VVFPDPEGELHKGYFQIPAGMVVRGERRWSTLQPALHLSQRSIFFGQRGFGILDTGYPRGGCCCGGWGGGGLVPPPFCNVT